MSKGNNNKQRANIYSHSEKADQEKQALLTCKSCRMFRDRAVQVKQAATLAARAWPLKLKLH
jgi:hypothetical protein